MTADVVEVYADGACKGNPGPGAMKQVAGTLRLDLAQFREMAAFAQFGSDLDKATLSQIEWGKRMVELLKQGQNVPMTMQDQVIVLFAGTQGYLDDIPVEAVKKFEEEFVKFIRVKQRMNSAKNSLIRRRLTTA